MRPLALGAIAAALLSSASWAVPIHDVSKREISELPRLVIYFQTTHDSDGNPISMLPLITEQGIALTHLIVCSFHINAGENITLNDYSPYDPHFYTLWNETVIMQQAGVKVTGMIGGASAGAFDSDTLDSTDDATFEYYYSQLYDVIQYYGLQGMDLDVEQAMSQDGITRLVSRLNADFGDGFIITLAPVATALEGLANLSGFNYTELAGAAVTTAGVEMIHFMNTQFYSGFGTMAYPTNFEYIVANGWAPTEIVAGQLTNPLNGGGYTDIGTLNQTVIELVEMYGTIGGIMGWEYFDSLPGGTAAPWEWAQDMTAILRPNDTLTLDITNETATILNAAWQESVVQPSSASSSADSTQSTQATVDYFAMVNA
ncbi:glycoside hydrolase [Cryphonectria parasitica EP155]|uniref:Glycoside hydrolase n=1 Tax=Cryphonectria parasitica (strain ATCC 38755 / EP155) TaxID=660469 RepID=A0A9P4XXK1_CRYP1|nr:glycoside hydrolase [Cryphonectria parasitica EP155]KAF3762716.1 glycoside hydrolase [Cryphonectria parasitica EP155]